LQSFLARLQLARPLRFGFLQLGRISFQARPECPLDVMHQFVGVGSFFDIRKDAQIDGISSGLVRVVCRVDDDLDLVRKRFQLAEQTAAAEIWKAEIDDCHADVIAAEML